MLHQNQKEDVSEEKIDLEARDQLDDKRHAAHPQASLRTGAPYKRQWQKQPRTSYSIVIPNVCVLQGA